MATTTAIRKIIQILAFVACGVIPNNTSHATTASGFNEDLDAYGYKFVSITYKIGRTHNLQEGILIQQRPMVVPQKDRFDIVVDNMRTETAEGHTVAMSTVFTFIRNRVDIDKRYEFVYIEGASAFNVTTVKWGDVGAGTLLSTQRKYINDAEADEMTKLHGRKMCSGWGDISGVSIEKITATDVKTESLSIGSDLGHKRVLLDKSKSATSEITSVYMYVMSPGDFMSVSSTLTAIKDEVEEEKDKETKAMEPGRTMEGIAVGGTIAGVLLVGVLVVIFVMLCRKK